MFSRIVSEVRFQPFVHPLYLSINLGMVACTWSQLSAHQYENFLQKITHESTLSITHNALGDPMQSKDFSEKRSETCAALK